MGRSATGVWGIALDKKDHVIDMVVVRRQSTLLAVTSKAWASARAGRVPRAAPGRPRHHHPEAQTRKTGDVVALKEVLPDDELMMITKKGIIIRVPVEGIRISGRNTQGVKVMNLIAGDLVVDVARVVKEDEADENGEAGDDDEAPAPKKAAKKAAPARGIPPRARPTNSGGDRRGSAGRRPDARGDRRADVARRAARYGRVPQARDRAARRRVQAARRL